MDLKSLVAGLLGGLLVLGALLVVGGNDQPQPLPNPFLGGTRFPNGISADSTAPSAGQVRGTTLTVTGASTLTGAATVSGAATLSSTLNVTGESILSLFTSGGATTSTTTAGNITLNAADVCNYKATEALVNVAGTFTFPTAAALIADCIPNIGDERKIWFHNSSSTAGATVTFADGTNGIHLEGEGLTTIMDALEWAEISIINYDGTRYVLDVEIRQDAD